MRCEEMRTHVRGAHLYAHTHFVLYSTHFGWWGGGWTTRTSYCRQAKYKTRAHIERTDVFAI